MTVKNYGLSGVSTQLQFGKGGAAFTFPTADGSNNQVLTTDGSGTLTWETTSGSSPLTTKGDVYTYSTVNARLAIGTDGHVLTADSAETTGLKWAAAPTGVWTSDGSDGAVISGIGNVVVHIEADTDNVGEDDTPTLLMTQDGGTITQHALKIDGSNRFVLENIAVTTGERGIYFQEEADAGGSTYEMAHDGNLTDLDIVQTDTNNTFTGTNTFPNGTVIAGSTGVMDFPAGRYTSTWAIDMNNSDIRGANGIYYNDEAQSTGEGFNWPLPGVGAYDSIVPADWMSIRAYQGDLLYWDGVTEFKMGQEMYEGTTVRVDTTTTADTVTVTGDLDISGDAAATNVEATGYIQVEGTAAQIRITDSDSGTASEDHFAIAQYDSTLEFTATSDAWARSHAAMAITWDGQLYLNGGRIDMRSHADTSYNATINVGRNASNTNDVSWNIQSHDVDEQFKILKAGRSGASPENALIIDADGGVKLYYDAALKLETVTGGVDITGTLTTTNINSVTGVNVAYNGTTKLSTTTSGITIYDTLLTPNINNATGVNLQYNAATVAKTAADGLIVNNPSGFISVVRVGATGSDPSVALWSDSNTNTAGITQLDGSGAFDDTWIGFSEDGGVSLYYNDVKTFETTATGIIVSSPTTSSLVVGTSTSTGTTELKLIQEDGGINWYCSNASASAILAQTDETGAFEKYWQINARNQGTTFYYNNNQCLETYLGGARLGVDGTTNGLIRFQSSTASGYIEQGMLSNEMVFSNSSGDRALVLTGHTADIGSNSGTDIKSYNMNNSNGRVSMLMSAGGDFGLYQYTNAAVIEDAWIICQRNGAVNLFHNNSRKVATTSTGIELGENDTGGTQNIDFQTFAGATTATYDARISASAGTVDVTGDGDLDVTAKNFNVTGTIVSSNKIQCNAPSGAIPFIAKRADVTTVTARTMMQFRNAAGTPVGNIDSTSTGTTYNTPSDYRLKTDVTPVASINAIATIDSLNPVTFKWHSDIITEDTPATFWGFIAHEVQAVYPQAVSGIKDKVYEEDGETIDVMQSMDYSTLTSVNTAGVKAVLELVRQQQTTINALTARIDALENP